MINQLEMKLRNSYVKQSVKAGIQVHSSLLIKCLILRFYFPAGFLPGYSRTLRSLYCYQLFKFMWQKTKSGKQTGVGGAWLKFQSKRACRWSGGRMPHWKATMTWRERTEQQSCIQLKFYLLKFTLNIQQKEAKMSISQPRKTMQSEWVDFPITNDTTTN